MLETNKEYTSLELDQMFQYPDYQRLWQHNKRLVIRALGSRAPNYFFFYKNENSNFVFLFNGADFEDLSNKAMPYWENKRVESNAMTQESCIDHIEGIVSSLVKKNKQDTLRKFDFSFVHYSFTDEKWHAFYPSTEKLLSRHQERTDCEHCEYCDYLRSEEYQSIRNEWDKVATIEVPTQNK
jgi:hypothetical protein